MIVKIRVFIDRPPFAHKNSSLKGENQEEEHCRGGIRKKTLISALEIGNRNARIERPFSGSNGHQTYSLYYKIGRNGK